MRYNSRANSFKRKDPFRHSHQVGDKRETPRQRHFQFSRKLRGSSSSSRVSRLLRRPRLFYRKHARQITPSVPLRSLSFLSFWGGGRRGEGGVGERWGILCNISRNAARTLQLALVGETTKRARPRRVKNARSQRPRRSPFDLPVNLPGN